MNLLIFGPFLLFLIIPHPVRKKQGRSKNTPWSEEIK